MKRIHLVALLLIAYLFSHLYLSMAFPLPQSQVSFHARLMVVSPFVYRMLIPYSLGLVMPPWMLDSLTLKMLMATASTLAFLVLMPAFARRVTGRPLEGRSLWALWLLGLMMLLAHYWMPRPYMFYYIYDLPAIPIYMACFLMLTRDSAGMKPATIALVVLASLNRETVVIALAHALGFHFVNVQGGLVERLRALTGFLKGCAAAIVLIVLARVGLNLWIQPQGDGNVAWMEGEYVRIYASLYRIFFHESLHARAVFLFGCGALIWIPLAYRHLPVRVKALLISSLPPLLLLFTAGNIVELRIYGEFIPLLALGLHLYMAPLFAKWTKLASS